MNFASLRWWSLLSAALAASGCTDLTDQVGGSVHVDYWRPNVAGEVSITKGSKEGTATPISLRRDVGLDHGDVPVLGADLDLGPDEFSFEYLAVALHGSTTVPHDFIFHAQTYPAGNSVATDLNVPTARLSWSHVLWNDRDCWWRAGLGGRLWTFDMTVKDETAGLREERRFSHLYPLAISDLVLDLSHGWWARVGGNVAALSTSQAVYEADAVVGWKFDLRFGAEVGWRFLRYDFNESTNDGDFNLSGPYIALRFLF